MSQIRDQKCACEIYPAIYRRSGAIGIRAVSARLSRLFRSSKPGDWGRSHQVEDQRGWRHTPCLLSTKNSNNHPIQKQLKGKTKMQTTQKSK